MDCISRDLTRAQQFESALPYDAELPALVSLAIVLPPHVVEIRRSAGRFFSLGRFLAPYAAQLTSLRLLHPSFFKFYSMELTASLAGKFTALRHLHVEMPCIQIPPDLTSLRSFGMSIVLDRTDVYSTLPDTPEITEVATQIADSPHDQRTTRNSIIILSRLAMQTALRTLTLARPSDIPLCDVTPRT